MNANPKFLSATAQRRRGRGQAAAEFAQGLRRRLAPRHARADARDHAGGHARHRSAREKNPPVYRLRHSGPYTDPAAKIDIRSGPAAAARRRGSPSAATRSCSPGPSSRYGRERLADPKLARAALQPEAQAAPRASRARTSRRCTTRAAASSRRRWSTSPSARTCSAILGAAASARREAAELLRGSTRASPSAPRSRSGSRPSSCATRSRAAAPSSRPTSTTRKPSR